MEDNKYTIGKLNILNVFKEGVLICKQNYLVLLQISFFSFLIFLFNAIQSYVKLMMAPGLSTLIYNIISFIIFFPVAYLEMKLVVALWIAISKQYNGEQITVKEAFSESARTTWAYVGTSILYSLMIFPIMLLFVPLFLMVQIEILKWTLILLLSIGVIYLAIVFGFAQIAAALEGANESNFKLSKMLVQGNLVRVAIIQFIIYGIGFSGMLVSNLNPLFKSLNYTNQIAAQIGYHFIYMFISPLIGAISIVLYITLRKKVTYAQNASGTEIIQE